MKIKRGSTSVRRLIFIADSSSTTGAGLANLVYNSSGLVAYYFAGDLNNEVQITLATATLGTYASGGFIAVDNTNMPGWYEIGIPDAALDGGNECAIQLRGATNMVPVNIYIELDAFDYQTATQPVNVTQFGGTNGTFSAGRPEVNTTHWGGTAVGSVTINCNMTQISGDTAAADNAESFFDGTGYAGTNNVIPTVTTVTNAVTVGTINANVITASALATDAVTEIQSGLASQTSVDTLATYVDTEVAAIKAKTDNLPSDPADQSAVEAAITAAIATVPTAGQNADAVWDEVMADHTGSTTYGGRIVRATNSNVSVQITGSNHISADVHAFQTDVIDATAFASSAVTEIQSGLATAAELAKVPKSGETRRYTQVAADSGNKTADVSIGAPL